MVPMTLIKAVRTILQDPHISEREAQIFASERFGELAAFIRAESNAKLLAEKVRLAEIGRRQREKEEKEYLRAWNANQKMKRLTKGCKPRIILIKDETKSI